MKKIRRNIEKLQIPHAGNVSEWVTVSIGGVTVTPRINDDYGTYLKIADTMLYDAKKGGRNQVVWANEQLKRKFEKQAKPGADYTKYFRGAEKENGTVLII